MKRGLRSPVDTSPATVFVARLTCVYPEQQPQVAAAKYTVQNQEAGGDQSDQLHYAELGLYQYPHPKAKTQYHADHPLDQTKILFVHYNT